MAPDPASAIRKLASAPATATKARLERSIEASNAGLLLTLSVSVRPPTTKLRSDWNAPPETRGAGASLGAEALLWLSNRRSLARAALPSKSSMSSAPSTTSATPCMISEATIGVYSNRNLTDVYAIVDRGGKREVKKILKGLKAPNGVAFKDGSLYFAEISNVWRLDDIENAEVPAVETYLAKIKVLRKISGKLIDFLTQLEEFQKKDPYGRLAIVNGPPGCQPAGSKVLMADGKFKNIEEVIVGDVVLSPQHNGTVLPVSVLETLNPRAKNDLLTEAVHSLAFLFRYHSQKISMSLAQV